MSDWQYSVGGSGFRDVPGTREPVRQDFTHPDIGRIEQMGRNQGLVDNTLAFAPFGKMMPKMNGNAVANLFGSAKQAPDLSRHIMKGKNREGNLFEEYLNNRNISPRDRMQRKQDIAYRQRPENRPKRASQDSLDLMKNFGLSTGATISGLANQE